MISQRSLKRKIKSIQSIQQITRAMKMVSSIKMKRSRERLVGSAAFFSKLDGLLSDLYLSAAGADNPVLSTYMDERKSGKTLLVVLTSDRGLCGGFNTAISLRAEEYIKSNPDKDIEIVSSGKKGKILLMRTGRKIVAEFPALAAASYSESSKLANHLLESFKPGGIREIQVIYSKFKSLITHPVITERLLPMGNMPAPAVKTDFISEPEPGRLISEVIPMYLKSRIFRILLDSSSSEHAARMMAMESATTNADDVLEELTLKMNRLRQEKITQEISEITATTSL